jgi:hypothetical protein
MEKVKNMQGQAETIRFYQMAVELQDSSLLAEFA